MRPASRPRLLLAAALLPLLALVAASIAYSRGGCLGYEAVEHLKHFIRPLPLLEMLFDPRAIDNGEFRGRELSYFVDWLDAFPILQGARLGFPHFLSVSHFLGVLLIAAGNVLLARKRFGERLVPAAALLSAMFLASPAAFLGGFYFRSAKILCATPLFFLAWRLAIPISPSRSAGTAGLRPARLATPARAAALTLLLGGIAAFSDEQGLFLLGLLGAISAGAACLERDGRRRELAAAAVSAAAVLLLAELYKSAVGPRIISFFGNARAVRMESRGLSLALSDAAARGEAYGIFKDWIGFQLGPAPLAFALVLLGLATPLLRAGKGLRARAASAAPLAAALLSAAALVFMTTMMLQAHSMLREQDLRRVYYGLPTAAALLLAATFAAGLAADALGRGVRVLEGALLLVLLTNLRALPGHARIVGGSALTCTEAESERLRECLVRTDLPVSTYGAPPEPLSWHRLQWCEVSRGYSVGLRPTW